MTKSHVSRYCSILNYIKNSDEDLYDIITDLCIARWFTPRRKNGITFLFPDSALVKKIKKIVGEDEPEKVIPLFKALILDDYLPEPSDFENKKSDIPTRDRKKLPIKNVSGDKIILSNGATLSPDKSFKPRSDRMNMAVYKLSGNLVPTDTEKADYSNLKKKYYT